MNTRAAEGWELVVAQVTPDHPLPHAWLVWRRQLHPEEASAAVRDRRAFRPGLWAGAWFVLGPALSALWASSGFPRIGVPAGGMLLRTVEQIGFFTGLGAVIIFCAALALGRMTVVPYRAYMRRRGTTVFGEPRPTKTCPECKAADLPIDAVRCRYCATPLSVAA